MTFNPWATYPTYDEGLVLRWARSNKLQPKSATELSVLVHADLERSMQDADGATRKTLRLLAERRWDWFRLYRFLREPHN
jgi:hypothetical protein